MTKRRNKFLNNKKSYLYAFAAVLFWSTVATAFKLTLQGITSAQLLFYSSAASLIILFFIAYYNSKNELKLFFNKKHLINNAVLGFVNPFIYYLILFKAYSILPAQEAQPINLVWPLILSIMSAIFLKQKLPLQSLIGLLISFTGILIVATHGNLFGFQFQNLTGDLLALSTSFIWAAFWILNLVDKREESIKLFGSFFFGTIYIAIYIAMFDSFILSEMKYFWGAVYVGLFEMGITFFVWLKALSLSDDKAKTSAVIYLFPVISLFFIAFVLGEKLLPSSVLGLAVIISGILFQRIKMKNIKS